jgi:Fe/S biogenesis protein NfuA
MAEAITEPVLRATDVALARILELRPAEDGLHTLGLRIVVAGSCGADFTYDLAFESLDECAADDVIYEQGGLTFVIPGESVDNLRGAILDLPSDAAQGGLALRNPNRPRSPSVGDPIELTGTPEEKIRALLEQQVNPAIAVHAGEVSLMKVDGSTAYIMMGGGCKGCALAALTLREGIETMILGAIPEITQVIDTTDHSAGENPYYS